MHRISSVRCLHDYVLEIGFTTGEHGELDISPWLNFGIFSRLKDINQFQKVRTAFGTIEWPCGADLDPDFVYKKCTITQST